MNFDRFAAGDKLEGELFPVVSDVATLKTIEQPRF